MHSEQRPTAAPFTWLAIAYSGLLIGALTIVTAVSLAALIFTGDLADHLLYGIQIALITAVVTGLIVALSGSSPFSISIPQDRIAPILAIMATSIVTAAPTGMPGERLFITVVAAIVATSLITGVTLFALGQARAGGLIRFMPYSVLGGYFAGTGWLLIVGGLKVMTGLRLDTWGDFTLLMSEWQLLHWLPGLVVAVAIVVTSRLLSYAKTLPLVLSAAGVLFYAITLHNGHTLQSLGDQRWLLGPLENGRFQVSDFALPRLILSSDWSLVVGQWANIATVVVLTSVSLILTISALEMLSGSDIDINRELRVSGVANIVAGLSGGMVGFHTLSFSTLALRLGVHHRAVGVIAALTAGVALIAGAEIIGLLPRMLVGGLLLFIGISMLTKWLLASWGRLPLGEYLVIPLILMVIATAGFIEGLVAGLLAALIQFVLNYSRTPVIRYALSGEHARSTVERSLDDERCLADAGRHVFILKLRGYLFFGTTAQLSARIRRRAEDPATERLQFAVLDFEQVNGIDSSAAYEFHRLRQMAAQRRFVLILTGLNADLRSQLHVSDMLKAHDCIREFVDFDHGLEWCEEQLLRSSEACGNVEAASALRHLWQAIGDRQAIAQFQGYLSEMYFAAGDELIRQGEAARDMFFLEQGEVSVYLQSNAGESVRIRRTGPGTVLGELGFYLDTPRTAAVIADTPGKAYRLSTDALRRIEHEHPELAALLHRFMADLLAERLVRTTRTLEEVLG